MVKNDSGEVVECQQCRYVKANGVQCKRTTCLYPSYCWQHSQQEYPFKIKNSTIPGAGKGLFSTSLINKHDLIHQKAGYYGGKVVTAAVYNNSKSTYGVSLSGNKGVMDGASTQSGLLRRANTKKRGQGGNNAKLIRVNQTALRPERIGAQATKRIPAGSEIFMGYGPGYLTAKRGNKK